VEPRLSHEDDTWDKTLPSEEAGFVGTWRLSLKSPSPSASPVLMGLYTILKKHRLKDRQLRLLFLGLDAAGKSTIVARLLSPEAPPEEHALKDISPTLGFKISTIEFENYKLNICMSHLAF
jgi:hypothetical protein